MADTDAKPVDQDALVADIDRTRTQLARTIDAISDRVNPKKNVARAVEQARQRADRAVEQARQRASQVDPALVGAAAAAVILAVTALVVWRHRKD